MILHANCPNCGALLKVPEDMQGKQVRCAKCKEVFWPEEKIEEDESATDESATDEELPAKTKEKKRKRGGKGKGEKRSKKSAKGRSVLAILGLVAGGLALLGGIGVGLYFMLVHEVVMQVGDAERGIVLGAEDLGPRLPGFKFQADLATLTKTRLRSGKYVIHYTYATPAGTVPPMYIDCQVHIATRDSDAQSAYVRAGADFKLGPDQEGKPAPQKVDQPLNRWGDESRCLLLRRDHDLLGNVFTARKGVRVFHVVFVGPCFSGGTALKALLEPILQRVEEYKP